MTWQDYAVAVIGISVVVWILLKFIRFIKKNSDKQNSACYGCSGCDIKHQLKEKDCGTKAKGV